MYVFEQQQQQQQIARAHTYLTKKRMYHNKGQKVPIK